MSSAAAQQQTCRVAKTSRTRLKKLALFELPPFIDDTICCETAHDQDDVLYSGSEDEYYESPAARSRCYATQARRFLDGTRPFLLSASLKGPFNKESGWSNPWIGRRAKASGTKPSPTKSYAAAATTTATGKRLQGRILSHAEAQPSPASDSDLWSSIDGTREPKKPEPGCSWLRTRNLKRANSNDAEVSATSPTATIHRNKSRKLGSFARSFSAPLEADRDEDGDSEESRPSEGIVTENGQTSLHGQLRKAKSKISDSDRATSASSEPPASAAQSVPHGENDRGETPAQTHTESPQFEDQQDASFCFQKRATQKEMDSAPSDGRPNDASDNPPDNQFSECVPTPHGVEDTHHECTPPAEEVGDVTLDAGAPGNDAASDLTKSNVDSGSPDEDVDDAEQIASQLNAVISSSCVQQDADRCLEAAVGGESSESALPTSLGIGSEASASQDVPMACFDDTTLLSFDHEGVTDGDVLMRNLCTTDKSTLSQLEPTYATGSSHDMVVADTTGNDMPSGQCLNVSTGPDAPSNELSDFNSKGVDGSEFLSRHNEDPTTVDGIPDADSTPPLTSNDKSEIESSRIATQDQSPWVKTPFALPSTPSKMSDCGKEASEQLEAKAADNASGLVASTSNQSPWVKDSELLPALVPTVEQDDECGPMEARPLLSLSQNPWEGMSYRKDMSFSSSIPKQLTSPCSPNGSEDLPHMSGEPRQENCLPSHQAQYLPSSLGTAPSTPDTKHSSLPTPDQTISIKSFRKFRSPTPTPLPRPRVNKPGKLRSALATPRRKFDTTSLAKSQCRVRFALPDEGGDDNEDTAHRAASPPPPEMVLAQTLPSEVDKFQGHFATVVNRANQRTAATKASGGTLESPLLKTRPAPSTHSTKNTDVFYSNPAVDVMVSRFREADAESAKLQGSIFTQGMPSQSSQEVKTRGSGEGDKENALLHIHDNELSGGGEPVVDDVQDVIDNLDDFLGVWDVDTELAKVQADGL